MCAMPQSSRVIVTLWAWACHRATSWSGARGVESCAAGATHPAKRTNAAARTAGLVDGARVMVSRILVYATGVVMESRRGTTESQCPSRPGAILGLAGGRRLVELSGGDERHGIPCVVYADEEQHEGGGRDGEERRFHVLRKRHPRRGKREIGQEGEKDV